MARVALSITCTIEKDIAAAENSAQTGKRNAVTYLLGDLEALEVAKPNLWRMGEP